MIIRLDLPSKLACVFLLWVCAFTLPWPIQASLCLVAIAARFAHPGFRPQSARSAKAFSKFILYSIAIATLVALLNAVLIRSGGVLGSLLGFSLYEEGLLFGLKTASRLLLLSFSILLFFISTPLPDFIRYLQSKGLPPYLVLVLLLTLHFLDQLPLRIHQIFLAQQARGAPIDSGIFSRSKALLSILSPLVLSSIVESIERGTAMELRGFLTSTSTTHHVAGEGSQRNLLTISLLLFAVIILVYSLLAWLIA